MARIPLYLYGLLAATGAAAMAVAISVSSLQAEAQSAPAKQTSQVTRQNGYLTTDGEALYRSSCQACHMENGQGAVGAGMYPALANNADLEDPGYAAMLVVNGYKAMPAFGQWMDDAQIAAVITFIRTNFGNSYSDPVNPEDVKALRP